MTRTFVKIKMYSRPGDKISLVASSDVRVNGMVVIARGARGQATVTDVPIPTRANSTDHSSGALLADLLTPQNGTVVLQLDWVEDVTGQHVPLRAIPTGDAKPFAMQVSAEQGGIVLRPPIPFAQGLKKSLNPFALFPAAARSREWAPTGTRVEGFVHGAVNLDLAEVKQAQALLPVPNPGALLTVYRTKDQSQFLPEVYCDEKKIPTLGRRQYTVLELSPGEHTCRAGKKSSIKLHAEASSEYYLYLHYRSFADAWELRTVDTAAGEDQTGTLQMIAGDEEPSPSH